VLGGKLDLRIWAVEYHSGWDIYFSKFDSETKRRILAKIAHMKQPLFARGLCKSKYCVEEVGQYRIAFIQNEVLHIKEIHFVGTHKQYEKWYKSATDL